EVSCGQTLPDAARHPLPVAKAAAVRASTVGVWRGRPASPCYLQGRLACQPVAAKRTAAALRPWLEAAGPDALRRLGAHPARLRQQLVRSGHDQPLPVLEVHDLQHDGINSQGLTGAERVESELEVPAESAGRHRTAGLVVDDAPGPRAVHGWVHTVD